VKNNVASPTRMEARKSRVQAGTWSPALSPISSGFLWLRRWYRHSALRLLLAEIRATGHRIRRILEIREVELLRGRGPVRRWMDESLVGGPQSYKLAYTLHMQQLGARYPFLSNFDLLLLGNSWVAGSEWRVRQDTSQIQESACSSDDSKGGNSMPPLATQQPTKLDPPGLLPQRN
jgi:hypothetical protein